MSNLSLNEYFDSFYRFLQSGDSENLERFLEENGASINPEYLSIYRNGFFKAGIDALTHSFPVTQNLLGEETFLNLAKTYVDQFPSRTNTLVGYGEIFGTIISDLTGIEYLKDFALLDQTWLTTLHTHDDTPVSAEELQKDAESGIDIGKISFISCDHVSIIKTDHNVFNLWVKIKQDNSLLENVVIEKQTQHILFWKKNLEVTAKIADPMELAFLSALSEYQTLELAVENLQNCYEPTLISEVFTNCLVGGLIKKA